VNDDNGDDARDEKRRRDAANARLRRAARRIARENADSEVSRDVSTTPSNVVAMPLKVPVGRLYDEHCLRVAILTQRVFADANISDSAKLRALASASQTLSRGVEIGEMRDEIDRIEKHLGIGRHVRRVNG
jgi:hypothetical protein